MPPMRKKEKIADKPVGKPMNLPEDKTRALEQTVLEERKPKAKYVARLWAYIFSSVKVMSAIYLGVFVSLSLLQPALALIWGRYINSAEKAAGSVAETAVETAHPVPGVDRRVFFHQLHNGAYGSICRPERRRRYRAALLCPGKPAAGIAAIEDIRENSGCVSRIHGNRQDKR